MREAKLICPMCRTSVVVTEDDIGEVCECPACGTEIEVGTEAFEGTAGESDELLDELTSGLEGGEERASARPSEVQPQPQPSGPSAAAHGPAEGPMSDIDFRLWQGLVEMAGDWQMAIRLDAWRQAIQAGVEMTVEVRPGVRMPIPRMVLSEAFVSAFQSQTEAEWRDGWTRRLLKVAAKWNDAASVEDVVCVISHTGPVVEKLKAASVWPW